MPAEIRDQTAIAGIGSSKFGRFLEASQLALAAKALKAALEDAGLERKDVDGLSIHMGWPLGIDYDRVAEAFDLDIRYVNQTWLHGRFVTHARHCPKVRIINQMSLLCRSSPIICQDFLGSSGESRVTD